MKPGTVTNRVKDKALGLGFDSVGITDLSPIPHGDALRGWLDQGYEGEMTYMRRQLPKRVEPHRIVHATSHAIMVTRDYPDGGRECPPGHGGVARYARGEDYHLTLREPLEQLCQFVCDLGGDNTIAKAFVDAGPVPERELAQRAGLGWIGKNTMLLDEKRGSYFFIGSVFTNLELVTDEPFVFDRCGSCTRCLDACPTEAFVTERVLDSRKCISYLTIELRGDFAPGVGVLLNDWIFGCDICQEVCPWNMKFASSTYTGDEEWRPEMECIPLDRFDDMSEIEFEREYGRTPLERPGLEGMRRNARAVKINAEAPG